jgi:hypothetical protein
MQPERRPSEDAAHRDSAGVDRERDSGGNDRAREQRVEALARELAKTINETDREGREALREVAVNLLQEPTDVVSLSSPEPAATATPFNPFGIGIPLILMGAVLVFLFPLVGLLMFGAAAVMLAWGLGTSLLARG